MAGNGTYREGKQGEIHEYPGINEDEIRDGLARELARLERKRALQMDKKSEEFEQYKRKVMDRYVEESIEEMGGYPPSMPESSCKGPQAHNNPLPMEWYALNLVLADGAQKHGEGTWLDPTNPSLQHKANHASMSRHLAEAYCGITEDRDSGLHPLLHLACRALMEYTRHVRQINTD